MPNPSRPAPEVVLSDERRWQQVERLLHDDTIRRYVRISGLSMLLWAQPLSWICRMRAEQIADIDVVVSVTFDAVPIKMPPPLDHLVGEHLTHGGQASYASRPDHWLFPGEHLGQGRFATVRALNRKQGRWTEILWPVKGRFLTLVSSVRFGRTAASPADAGVRYVRPGSDPV